MSTQYTINCFAIINLLLLNIIKTTEKLLKVAWTDGGTVLTFPWQLAWKRLHRVQLVK